jgi:hypothetical protein
LDSAVAQALVRYQGEKGTAVAGELALLWEAAREFARAADCYLEAAQNAARLFANQEVIVLARRGLELLKSLPEAPERDQLELKLEAIPRPGLDKLDGARRNGCRTYFCPGARAMSAAWQPSPALSSSVGGLSSGSPNWGTSW